jgi:nitroreductase
MSLRKKWVIDMELNEIVKNRYSVRDYSDERISIELIREIIANASWAPSAKNHQPYQLHLVEDEKIIENMRMEKIPVFNSHQILVFSYDENMAWKNKRNNSKPSGEMDTSIFATYVMLLLWNKGIGSCMVAAFDPSFVKNLLHLDENMTPCLMMPIGYPSKDSKPLEGFHDKRKDVDEVFKLIS